MDWQNLLTLAVSVGLPLLAGWVKNERTKGEARAAAIELRAEQIGREFNEFRLEVAKEYVRNTHLDEIKETLRRIEELLHTKADKRPSYREGN